jgi:hypothetical protein
VGEEHVVLHRWRRSLSSSLVPAHDSDIGRFVKVLVANAKMMKLQLPRGPHAANRGASRPVVDEHMSKCPPGSNARRPNVETRRVASLIVSSD